MCVPCDYKSSKETRNLINMKTRMKGLQLGPQTCTLYQAVYDIVHSCFSAKRNFDTFLLLSSTYFFPTLLLQKVKRSSRYPSCSLCQGHLKPLVARVLYIIIKELYCFSFALFHTSDSFYNFQESVYLYEAKSD